MYNHIIKTYNRIISKDLVVLEINLGKKNIHPTTI